MDRTPSCCQCEGAGSDRSTSRRYHTADVSSDLSVVADRDHVRGRSRTREIHVRLDLPGRFPSRRYNGDQGKGRFGPDPYSRILDQAKVCSRRSCLLDERDSRARTILWRWSRLQRKPWRFCLRCLHRNNPRWHPFRNFASSTCPFLEVPGNGPSFRFVRSQHWVVVGKRVGVDMGQHSDLDRFHLRGMANPEILVPLHMPGWRHYGGLPEEQTAWNAPRSYLMLKFEGKRNRLSHADPYLGSGFEEVQPFGMS